MTTFTPPTPPPVTPTQEIYTALVSRHLAVEDVTYGDHRQHFIARYRGHLYEADSSATYEKLSASLKPYSVTPLFRWEGDQHAVFLLPELPRPRTANAWWNLILFLATLLSVLFTGATLAGGTPDLSRIHTVQDVLNLAIMGAPFAISLLAILGAHEFGHYLVGRFHHVRVTLPYFIPFPFSVLGTLGAFINIQEPPRNRRVMFDISIAGPLAGLVVAIPILIYGLTLSHVGVIPTTFAPGEGITFEGNSILYLLIKRLVFNQWLPIPASYGDLPAWLYWLKYFFTGKPYPLGGMDAMIHPIVWAGWAGLLVTCLNLIPAGQLDGGHILDALIGKKRMARLLPVIILFLGVMGLVWSGWWIWAFLLLMFGRVQSEMLDMITPVDERRRLIGLLMLIIFLLVFTPVPLITLGG